MTIVGIICEYNPFHNGHLFHLNKVKELFPDGVVVLVMSGHFMQRGDVSVINKWDKTKIALEMGIDLVIELPFVFASQSADVFASGAIQILKALGVNHLVFGSENDNIDELKKIANVQDNNKYDVLVKEYLDGGSSYPAAVSKALQGLSDISLSKPNELLGVSYIKAINNLKANINPICIKRTNDYHSEVLDGDVCSATSIRKALKEGKKVDNFVPGLVCNYLDNTFFIESYFSLLKYKIISDINILSSFQTVDEGIENRIKKYIYKSNSLDELIGYVKTKRYTYNKIKRMLVHILCSFTKEEASKYKRIGYIRALGFNEVGKSFLNSVKKDISIPIISNFSGIKDDMLELEFRVNAVYASILDEEKKSYLTELEYKSKPIIK